MKKIICVILVVSCVVFGQYRKSFSLQDYFYGEYYSFTEQQINESSLSLGFCYMNKNKRTTNMMGEKMICKNLEIGAVLKTLKAKVVKTEVIQNFLVIYAYTPIINSSVKNGNKLTNLQIVEKEDCCVIGWPVVLSDF